MDYHVSAVRPMARSRNCHVHKSDCVRSLSHRKIGLLRLHPREHTVILVVHIG